MCSFLITNLTLKDIKYINYKLSLRGPDSTNIKIINGITFIHNLLSITGNKINQPFENHDNTIVVLFNGEIYNYKFYEKFFNKTYQTDGECLIDLYNNYGETFTQKIDGEFSVVLFDFVKNKIIVSSDIFATKPMYMAFNNGKFAISTYKYALEELGLKDIYKLQANTILSIDLITHKFNYLGEVYTFKLNQHKSTFNDFNKAIENAIRKMTQNLRKKVFITLSSGYDSGSIACLLNKLNIDFMSLSLKHGEDLSILNNRIEKLKNNNKITYKSYIDDIDQRTKTMIKVDLLGKIDKFNSFLDKDNNKPYNILNDDALTGFAYLFKKAKQLDENNLIHLSGQGADEIFSDYGFNGIKIKSHSCFGGKFPQNLRDIFPWHSFYKGTQECFINKEEHVAGCYGIENRYPFLDREVVQEFLYLSPVLKNKYYKAPLYQILKNNKFPFSLNEKKGFSV